VRYDHFNRTNQRHKEARSQDTHHECPHVRGSPPEEGRDCAPEHGEHNETREHEDAAPLPYEIRDLLAPQPQPSIPEWDQHEKDEHREAQDQRYPLVTELRIEFHLPCEYAGVRYLLAGVEHCWKALTFEGRCQV